jgi:hypothetical protein
MENRYESTAAASIQIDTMPRSAYRNKGNTTEDLTFSSPGWRRERSTNSKTNGNWEEGADYTAAADAVKKKLLVNEMVSKRPTGPALGQLLGSSTDERATCLIAWLLVWAATSIFNNLTNKLRRNVDTATGPSANCCKATTF